MTVYAILALGAVLGGAVQASTGFGAALVMLLLLSRVLDLVSASSINIGVCLALNLLLAWQCRRKLDLRPILPLLLPFLLAVAVAGGAVQQIDLRLLGAVFGAFLLAVALYSLLFTERVRIRPGAVSSVAVGVTAGLFGGLFGISGPLIAVYLVNVTDDSETYMGNMQVLFAAANVVSLIVRGANGAFNVSLLPLILVGVVAVNAGKWLGLRVFHRLDAAMVKKAVYVLVGVSGVITLAQNLLP